MDTGTVVLIVLLVLVLLGAALWYVGRQRRQRLQQRFGPEYERVVAERGDRSEAERQLRDVAARRDALDIRPLDAATRQRYAAEWSDVQARFVDSPGPAVDAADLLVARVMRERGYPVEDFESRAALAAADHPEVVEHYRAAHEIHTRAANSAADTEDLRAAFVHYRALFDVLLREPARDDGRRPS